MRNECEGFYASPTLRQRFWRALGFRYHLGDDPEGVDDMPGWMRTDTVWRFGWADRLRLVASGRLKVSIVAYTDAPSPDVVKNRCDWIIFAPGDQP